MPLNNNNRLSLFTLLALFIFILSFGILFQYSQMKYLRYVISWDVFGYYLYLPAAFIQHDITLQHFDWVLEVQKKYEASDTLYQLFNTPHDGKNTWVIKYSMGASVLYAPFFFISHLLAGAFGYPADGFSIPYQIGTLSAGYFYTLCGLLLVRKVLLNFFPDKITALVLFLLVAGTNYFEYTAWEGAVLSHVLLFFVNAAILYLTVLWHKNPKLLYALQLGAFIALGTITRPFEIVWLFVPLLWGIGGENGIRNKIVLFRKHSGHILAFIAGLLAVGSMQMLYWKAATGSYLYFTYTEEFFFLKPFILKVLFSFKKGWLLYTPLMIFALAGFIYVYNKSREHFLALFLCFTGYLYLISSFEGWWYSSSFSNRALLETYALLCIPLGFSLQYIQEQKKLLKSILVSVIALLVLLNLFQTWQYKQEILDKERMTKNYYWAVFLKTSVDEETRELLEVDRLGKPPKNLESAKRFSGRTLSVSDFDSVTDEEQKKYVDTSLFISSHHSLKMDPLTPFAATYEIQYSDLTSKEYAWIKASANVYFFDSLDCEHAMLVTNFKHQGQLYGYRGTTLSLDSFKINAWNKMVVYYLTPLAKSATDTLQVYMWYNGKKHIRVDDFTIEAFEPK
ncbi:MAG: hypothetical protein EPN85_04285 [Bacteroidetes bacterium]|nr:MAG: hypothetical protein EPN85_04285 [Bacteroidota bacterium]